MTWSWNKLSAAKWEDAWSERIAGNPNAVITKIKGGKTVRITVYCDDEEDALALKKYFGGTVREIKTQDWVATQKREKRPPLKIRDALVITEQSSTENLAALRKQFPSRCILSVPAEMAFGTGDHATTSTCLRFICDAAKSRRKTSWSMTDIGCGTAVLAMAALKLGAEHATAFDFDPMAIEVARHNMVRNAVTAEQLDLFVEDVFEWKPSESQQGDLVVANLFSTILQKAFPQIIAAMKKDAALVISGILASQWEETKMAAERHGLFFERVVQTAGNGYGKGRNSPVANKPASAFLFRPHGPAFIGTAIPGFLFKNLRIPAPLLQKTGMHFHCPAGKTSPHARHVILLTGRTIPPHVVHGQKTVSLHTWPAYPLPD